MGTLSRRSFVRACAALPALAVAPLLGGCDDRDTFKRTFYHEGVYAYGLAADYLVRGHQGVTYEDGSYWVSNNNALYRYDHNWELVGKYIDPLAEFDDEVNHIGDIDVYNGELYVVVEQFENLRGSNMRIGVYDAWTLDLMRTFPLDSASGQKECSGIVLNRDTNSLWLCSWADDVSSNFLYEYDLESGRYLRRIQLKNAPKAIQGITFFEGAFYLSADDGKSLKGAADHIYRAVLEDEGSFMAAVTRELTLDMLHEQGECEGLCFDEDRRQLIVNYNLGAAHVFVFDMRP